MRVRSVCATLAVSALSSATPAHADFRTALGEYNAGRYELAHTQFLALAELGDCSSQFNLGAMALKGEGGPQDAGSGGLSGMVAYKSARRRADAGDPGAGYLVGLTATLEPSLGISPARAAELLLGSARDGDSRAQYWAGSQLRATAVCHGQANGAVWLRHAADGGSASAQLMLATDLLNGDPSAAQLAEARSLLERAAISDSFYVRKRVVALLAASPLDSVRDPGTALSVAMKLAAGEIQTDPQMFEAVGAAYAANGDFRQASAQQQTAIRKAQSLAWNTRVMAQRLSAYRGGRPWRGDLLALPPVG